MKLGVIILARANYGRWPDKVLYRLQGKSILEHVIKKCHDLNVDEVIVSTTTEEEDYPVRLISRYMNANRSYGPADDRTARYCQAIEDYNLDYFMPISPATPFFDVDYVNSLINLFRINPDYDYYTIGMNTEFVPRIFRSEITLNALNKENRDEEIFYNPASVINYYRAYNWYDPELKNRYLFNGNIAYQIQADNHRRICAYLGHFPESYDEVVEALNNMKEFP